MKVLLVIDVQNDFCPGGALAIKNGDAVIKVINNLMEKGEYDLIIASQDFHPAGHKSFASSHPGKNVFDVIDLNGVQQVLWPDHCVQGTPGANFHPDLDLSRIDCIVQKGLDPSVDSYSAFRDNAKDRHTELLGVLVQAAAMRGETLRNIEPDVVGLALDYCDLGTAIDGADFGLKMRMVLDGTKAVDQRPENIERVILELRTKGIGIITSEMAIPHERKLVVNQSPAPIRRDIDGIGRGTI